MIGKLIGAAAGAQAAKHSASIGGTGGALLGAMAVPLVRRFSIPALVAVGVGGYLAKRAYDRKQANGKDSASSPAQDPSATQTQD